MRPRGQSTAHAQAVSRRLELLSSEISELREHNGTDDGHTHLRELRPSSDHDGADSTAGVVELGPTRDADASVAIVETPDTRSGSVSAPSLPVPGRHVAARRSHRWIDVSSLHGRVGLTAAQVAALAVLVAVGLAVTAWWIVRDDPGAVVATPVGGPALVTPADESTTPGGAGASVSAGPVTELVVDVTGKVRHPGIVVLPPGSRVADALKAAGGPRRQANLRLLNRARLVVDGEQIVVGEPAPPGLAASSAPVPGAPAVSLINLNSATGTELQELPGVGPVTAEAILTWREANGGFRSVDQLLDVDGIGEKTLAQLAPLVTL